MIIGAYRKYQVKLYLCRAFGEVANHTSRWGAQANLKTINKGKNDNNNKKQTKKKSKQTNRKSVSLPHRRSTTVSLETNPLQKEKVILKKISQAKKHDFVMIVALCNKIVTLCNTCRTL